MTITSLRAEAIAKQYGRSGGAIDAVRALTLSVSAGELVAVTGASASGKTTVVNLLAGWEQPDAGAVTWDGALSSPPEWAELTVVPQSLALIEELNVIENITLPSRDRVTARVTAGVGIAASELDTLIDALGLSRLRERSVDEISVGERQRVIVARALAGRPSVILADEPVAHQDERNAHTILRLLRERAEAGAVCVVATRERDVAAFAYRTIRLDDAARPDSGVRDRG